MDPSAATALDTATRYGNLRRLREALDAMPEGVAYFDAQDRLVAWNAPYAELRPTRVSRRSRGLRRCRFNPGARTVVIGAQPDATGQEEAGVVAERTSARTAAGQMRLPASVADGRWLRVEEARNTPDGGSDLSLRRRHRTQDRRMRPWPRRGTRLEGTGAARRGAEFVAGLGCTGAWIARISRKSHGLPNSTASTGSTWPWLPRPRCGDADGPISRTWRAAAAAGIGQMLAETRYG